YKAAKYSSRMIGYGSERDFSEKGIYIVNNMFPSQRDELKIRQEPKIPTKLYYIDNENLFSRKKHREDSVLDAHYLTEEDAISLGENSVKHSSYLTCIMGQSGMSVGSLGDQDIAALARGLAMAGETWMNTGEGSISPYHQKSDVS